MKNQIADFIGQKEPIRIKEITISASRTINLGNYESMQVQGSCTVEIDANCGSDIVIARNKALEEVKIQMNEAYKAIKPKK